MTASFTRADFDNFVAIQNGEEVKPSDFATAKIGRLTETAFARAVGDQLEEAATEALRVITNLDIIFRGTQQDISSKAPQEVARGFDKLTEIAEAIPLSNAVRDGYFRAIEDARTALVETGKEEFAILAPQGRS